MCLNQLPEMVLLYVQGVLSASILSFPAYKHTSVHPCLVMTNLLWVAALSQYGSLEGGLHMDLSEMAMCSPLLLIPSTAAILMYHHSW